jgi:hypothetical protein
LRLWRRWGEENQNKKVQDKKWGGRERKKERQGGGIEIGKNTHVEIDGSKIHIMPLRQINDPRHFTS